MPYLTCTATYFVDQFSSEAPYRLCLCQVFKYFLQFSEINLKASELGICTFTGQWEYIANNMRWLPRTYAIFVRPSPSLCVIFLQHFTALAPKTKMSIFVFFFLNVCFRLKILSNSQKILLGQSVRNNW